jgi:DNA-binding response OmpR family regulator
MADIIVVDDDPELREMLAEALGAAGHAVRRAAGGEDLRRLVAERPPALVLLDVGLPGEDGLRLARWLRERHDPGIVMLTAADAVVDRVVGLEVGADDYVAKPCPLAELRARVEAVLRRRRPRDAAAPLPEGAVRFGPYLFDTRRFLLVGADGREVSLSPMELDLVAAFALHPGRALGREDLMRLAPPRDGDSFDRSIDNRITRLRRKLEADPEKPELIKTLRGAGYIHPGRDPG